MKIITEQQVERKVAPQPWHNKAEEVRNYFQNRAHIDVTTESGFSALLSNESLRSQYNELVAGLVGDNEELRQSIESIQAHTMNDVRTGFVSQEGSDAMANNANYTALARLNSWVIVGYTARAKCLEMFHTISSDGPTVSYKYNLDYITYGDSKEKYYRPQADRDGDLGFMYDLPQLLPAVKTGEGANPNIVADNAAASTNGGSKVWLKIEGGVSGNLFDDSDATYDQTKYTLEKNPKITGIKYSIGSTNPVTGSMAVYLDRKTSTGEQQKKIFSEKIVIPYNNGAASATAQIMGEIDLDNGDYNFAAIGPVTHIQLDVRLTNVANELGTIRSGNTIVVEDFDVDNHPYGSVPVVPEMSDDFNAGGEGVSATAFFVDKVTTGLANMRDVVMERELDNAYNKPVDQFKLYPKVGGWKGSVAFPLAARLPGGGDPYSWMKMGLKTTIMNHLSRAETDTYFEDATPRQWYILGHETDVNLLPDVTYSTWDGEGGVGGATDKYGFQVNGKCGFIDNLGRRVRVIGSVYRRHLQDKAGNRIPMRAVCKSESIEQPTTVYLPYSFRVYSGISPEYSKRTGLLVSARDCIRVLSGIQSRVQLLGNSDELYSAITTENAPSTFDFGDKSKVTITAE